MTGLTPFTGSAEELFAAISLDSSRPQLDLVDALVTAYTLGKMRVYMDQDGTVYFQDPEAPLVSGVREL